MPATGDKTYQSCLTCLKLWREKKRRGILFWFPFWETREANEYSIQIMSTYIDVKMVWHGSIAPFLNWLKKKNKQYRKTMFLVWIRKKNYKSFSLTTEQLAGYIATGARLTWQWKNNRQLVNVCTSPWAVVCWMDTNNSWVTVSFTEQYIYIYICIFRCPHQYWNNTDEKHAPFRDCFCANHKKTQCFLKRFFGLHKRIQCVATPPPPRYLKETGSCWLL